MFDTKLVDMKRFEQAIILNKSAKYKPEHYLGESNFMFNTKNIKSAFNLRLSDSILEKPYIHGSYVVRNKIMLSNTKININKKTKIGIFSILLYFVETFVDEFYEKYTVDRKFLEEHVHLYTFKPATELSTEIYIDKMKALFNKHSIYFSMFDYEKPISETYDLIQLSFTGNVCQERWNDPEVRQYRSEILNSNNNFYKTLLRILPNLNEDGSLIIFIAGITNMFSLAIIQVLKSMFSEFKIEGTNIMDKKNRLFNTFIVLKGYNSKTFNIFKKYFDKSNTIKQEKVLVPEFLYGYYKDTCDKIPVGTFIKDLDKDLIMQFKSHNDSCLDEYFESLDRTEEEAKLIAINACKGMKIKEDKDTLIRKNNKFLFEKHEPQIDILPRTKPIIFLSEQNNTSDIEQIILGHHYVGYLFEKRNLEEYDKVKKLVRLYKTQLKDMVSEKIDEYKNKKSVSQAWLKMWEIIKNFDLIKKKSLKTLHLAEAPGGFIWAIEYYCIQNNIEFDWTAQSYNFLVDNTVFGDDYNMYRNNKSRWDFGPDGLLGDITDIRVLKHYQKYKVELITNDAGIDWSSATKEYAEKLQFCALSTALIIPTTNSVIKVMLANTCCPAVASIFMLLCSKYKKVSVYKPLQNEYSSEFYVICENQTPLTKEETAAIESIIIDFKPTKALCNIEDSKDIYEVLNKQLERFSYQCHRSIFYLDNYKSLTEKDKETIEKAKTDKTKDWIKRFL